jgi:sugar phosphate isomerase/epimerase
VDEAHPEIMPILNPLEPGVMLWAGRDDLAVIRELGVRCGQLGIGPEAGLEPPALDGFTLVTVFAAFAGESYADIRAVRQTVGFVPLSTRQHREARMYEVSDFAARLGVASIACHIGCIPEDRAPVEYAAIRDLVRRICDFAAERSQSFALETGQESASALLRFVQDVERSNLKINFDPANMILYGTGDPIEALELLAPLVVSVHAKDGDGPPPEVPGALGTEQPLGRGAVGVPRFVAKLRQIGFRGPLNVEREVEDQQQRLREIREGIQLLRQLTGGS